MSTPKASVVIAVYNHWEWLHLILDALAVQTEPDFEIIIADDGSDTFTTDKIEAYIASCPTRQIRHLWHDDRGWQKNIMLNKAVMAAASDYIIFLDGDCIPHHKFVADHLQLRRPHTVVAGRRVDITKTISDNLEACEVLPHNLFSHIRLQLLRNYLLTLLHGRKPERRCMRMLLRTIHYPFVGGHALGKLDDHGILGCNFSIAKEDLLAVNGFDERYLDPGTGEDTDLEVRLSNFGTKIIKTSRYALVVHRCHARLPLDSPDNAALLRDAMANHTTATPYGINTHR